MTRATLSPSAMSSTQSPASAAAVLESTAGDAQAIVDAMEQYHRPQFVDAMAPNGTPLIAPIAIVPKGMKTVDLKEIIDQYAPKPERRLGTAHVVDAASFVKLINRFKSAASVVYAQPSPTAPTAIAVLDYHPEGGDVTAAAFGGHQVKYPFPVSEEWRAWTSKSGVAMDMPTFASFLEDRIQDVLLVDSADDVRLTELAERLAVKFAGPSELIALSRGLQINVEGIVKEALTLSSGEISVQFTEQHTDGRGTPVKVANAFVIAIPVFYGDHPYRLVVRLRYRLQQGRIAWTFHIHRAQFAMDDAFRLVCESIQQKTELPLIYGTPEA